MDSVTHYVLLAGDLLRLVAVATFIAFVFYFAWLTLWEATEWGKHIMQSSVGYVLMLSMTTGFAVLDFHYPGSAYVRLASMLFIIYIVGRRFWLLVSAQRASRRIKNEPPPLRHS